MNAGTRGRGAGLFCAALLAGLAACAPGGGQADDGNWEIVQAYLALDAAWHASEPGQRGDHPPIELALAAARTIVADAAHPRLVETAEFLIEHPYGMTPDASEAIGLGLATLVARVGADWQVVADYERALAAWEEERRAAAQAAAERRPGGTAEASNAPGPNATESPLPRPPILQAMAAATAVAARDGHPHQRLAAEFLIANSHRLQDAARFALAGVDVLTRFADYDGWPPLLTHLYDLPGRAQVDGLFETLIESGEDAALRATARYYLAASLMRAANDFGIAPTDLEQRRRRALATATGLSAGVETATMARPDERGPDGAPLVTTLADAERALLFRIEHATAGGTLPAAKGRRLDGVEEDLGRLAGKVVLIDFWATWCAPCIRALPTLRKLHDELPPARFALLAVSVDAERETVVGFQRDEPMPWANWHVGVDSALGQAWEVRAFPTYILVDGDGTILARTNSLSPAFVAFIRARVAEAPLASRGGVGGRGGTPARWSDDGPLVQTGPEADRQSGQAIV